jgi:hypothetical protein
MREKVWRTVISLALLVVLLTLSSGSVALQGEGGAPAAPDYQLLTNPSMEVYDDPYDEFEGVDCQVATGWERFWYGDSAPCWMDTRVFAYSHLGGGWVERIDGETSQLLISTDPYFAGIRQQVTGLTPGVGYGFHAALLTIFRTSAPPAEDGNMIKQIGIDPTGGIDPQAPTVLWTEPDDHDEGPWDIDHRIAAFAESTAMTVFIRVESPNGSGGLPYMNLSFLDSAILALTPEAEATSPAFSEDLTFAVNWDNAVPAPGGTLGGYDVQWLDEAEGVWHDWFTETDQVEATFTGEWGHTYRFRARVWQHYTNGAWLYSPYRAAGDAQTTIAGATLAGQVLNNEGQPVGAATVVISGTTYSDMSDVGGRYMLTVPPGPELRVVTVEHPSFLAPAPVYSVTLGLTDTEVLTWTLRPLDDAVDNGGFEMGLNGWSFTATQGVTPTVVMEPVHTGRGALSIGGASPVSVPLSLTTRVSQTVILTAAWEPILSFWYHPVTTDTEDLFNVVLTTVTETVGATLSLAPSARVSAPEARSLTPALAVTTTQVFTPALDVEGWQHRSYYLGPPGQDLTATVTIEYRLWQDGDGAATTVYLDEVSLGSAPPQIDRVYLPLVVKEP